MKSPGETARGSRRPQRQLSLPGSFGRRAGEVVRGSRPVEPRSGGPASQAPARRGPNPGADAGFTPLQQMYVLLRNAHLLRPKEREWVERIGRTVSRGREDAELSERQSAVIVDIFDRFRERVGR